MTMKTLALCATACALTLGTAGAAQAIALVPAVEYTAASSALIRSDTTFGLTFSLSSSATLNALGFFDDGQRHNHQVGIWDSSNLLVASTTVLGTGGVVGHFRWTGISLTTLGPGTYTIGGEVFGGDDIPVAPTGVTTIPEYTYGGGFFHSGSGLVQPTTASDFGGDNGFIVANFSIVRSGSPPGSVPEPAAWTLMIAGFGLTGAALRRRRFSPAL